MFLGPLFHRPSSRHESDKQQPGPVEGDAIRSDALSLCWLCGSHRGKPQRRREPRHSALPYDSPVTPRTPIGRQSANHQREMPPRTGTDRQAGAVTPHPGNWADTPDLVEKKQDPGICRPTRSYRPKERELRCKHRMLSRPLLANQIPRKQQRQHPKQRKFALFRSLLKTR